MLGTDRKCEERSEKKADHASMVLFARAMLNFWNCSRRNEWREEGLFPAQWSCLWSHSLGLVSFWTRDDCCCDSMKNCWTSTIKTKSSTWDISNTWKRAGPFSWAMSQDESSGTWTSRRLATWVARKTWIRRQSADKTTQNENESFSGTARHFFFFLGSFLS